MSMTWQWRLWRAWKLGVKLGNMHWSVLHLIALSYLSAGFHFTILLAGYSQRHVPYELGEVHDFPLALSVSIEHRLQ